MDALQIGLFMLLLLSMRRNSTAGPVAMSMNPVATTRAGDPLTGLLAFTLLVLILLEEALRRGV